ncbi:MAG: hypothetical protein IKG32_06765 [Clostridia bacterium]|nr:hypothetical protein [Clostridia bacterium]
MRPKINFLRLILFGLVALVLSGGLFAVFYLMFRQRDVSLTYEKLGIQANMDYTVSGNYLSYASATDLVQVNIADTKKSTITHLDNGAIDGFGVSSTMTAAYVGSSLQLRNFDTLTLNGTIRGVACGEGHCAALRTNDISGLDSIVVFNASAQAVGNPIDFAESKVVNFGFETKYGREMLWVICVNTQASLPVTTVRLYDYNNGGTMSYYPSFYEQSIERVYFTEDSVFLVGTEDIIRYSMDSSRERYRVGIYGKEVMDVTASGGTVRFLLKPRGSSNQHTLYTLALAEADAPNTTMLTVYVGENIVNAFLQASGIRIVTRTRMISYTFSGKNSPSADIILSYPADNALKLDESSFLLVSGDDCYIAKRQS